jgi:Resolvase, N terminal domain
LKPEAPDRRFLDAGNFVDGDIIGTAAGKAFLDMLGVFAEFETNLRRERQLEGISAAKARGIYKGRKPSIDGVEVLRLRREEKLGPAAIARRLNIGEADDRERVTGRLVCNDNCAVRAATLIVVAHPDELPAVIGDAKIAIIDQTRFANATHCEVRPMKIHDMKTYRLEAELAEPFAYSQAWYQRRSAMLVEIIGEDGSSGWGEAFGPAGLTAPIADYYKPLLIGSDAVRNRAALAKSVQPAARSRPEGTCDRGAERDRHRAMGSEGPASRPAGAPSDGRPDAQPRPGLCDRILPKARRRRGVVFSR